jgi:hypothetical protein
MNVEPTQALGTWVRISLEMWKSALSCRVFVIPCIRDDQLSEELTGCKIYSSMLFLTVHWPEGLIRKEEKKHLFRARFQFPAVFL